MAMKPGTLKWGTLATMSNDAVYKYFRTVQGQGRGHAWASLRKVRSMFDPTGKRRPCPVDISVDFYRPPAWLEDECYEHKPQINAPAQAPVPVTETQETEEMGQNNNAADALAALIAPAMAGMVGAEIKKAVAEIHANMAPVKQLVVVKDKVEVELGELFHAATPKVIQLVNQGASVMLVGPAGCGKTMLAEKVAEARKLPLTLISCSAGMSEAQLLGRLLPLGANGAFTYVESPFMRAYANGGVILLDEMDAADANLLLVINAALANGGITVEARAALGPEADTYVKRHPDTVVIAAANTWGGGADTQYVGRGALDVSTLDRFYRMSVDYDTDLEAKLGSKPVVSWVKEIRTRARANQLRRVVSTRMITRIEKALAAGVTFAEAKRDELASWSQDERAKVGE